MLGLAANSTGFDVLGPVVGQLIAPDPVAIALLALLLFVAAALRRRVWFEAAPGRPARHRSHLPHSHQATPGRLLIQGAELP